MACTFVEDVASSILGNWQEKLFNRGGSSDLQCPRHIAYRVVHNHTVNTDGKPGHGKPVDQLVEHYNL